MSTKEAFIEMILKNLHANGFPNKRVTFDIEKIYEAADKKGFSFNSIIPDLNQQGVAVEIQTEKILFSQFQQENETINQDMFAQAQEMLSKMSPEEIDNIKQMYENMSDEEKENIMNQAKNMGMFK